ncbi:MAG: Maf family nucleotide pyrophosphatase [Muribaculaceae bacterium]
MNNETHHLDFHTGTCPDNHTAILPPLPSEAYAGVNVLLASNSPRRRELLGLILPSFEIATPRDVDEVYPPDMAAADVPAYLSQLKAKAYADLLAPGELIITADTIVIADGAIMGKPHDEAEAAKMLHKLENATHTVVTGVTLMSLDGAKNDTFSETTLVTFGPLTDDEITRYVARYRPLDKAGAYGIQEWIGAAAIARVDGCFYNVMGLPLHSLYTHLKNFYR